MSDIVERLQKAFEESGLSYRDVEQRTGLPAQSIHRYVTGRTKKLPIDTMKQIALAIGVSPAWVMGWADSPEIKNVEPLPQPTKTIPLYAAIGAGAAKIADDYIEGYIDVDGKADFAVRVEGDSMTPTILNGDIILVRQACDVDDNDIAVILKDDSAVCKRIHHIPHAIVCMSDNEAYDPFILKDAKILGKVVGLHREF